MTTKHSAQNQARKARREMRNSYYEGYGDHTVVNVKEVSKGNFGVRFSKKGTRDKFNWRKQI